MDGFTREMKGWISFFFFFLFFFFFFHGGSGLDRGSWWLLESLQPVGWHCEAEGLVWSGMGS